MAIEHRSAANMVHQQLALMRIKRQDRVLQFFKPAFDGAVQDRRFLLFARSFLEALRMLRAAMCCSAGGVPEHLPCGGMFGDLG